MLYTLNLYKVICQLYLNKAGKKELCNERMFATVRRFYTDTSPGHLNGLDFIFIVPSKTQLISSFTKGKQASKTDSVLVEFKIFLKYLNLFILPLSLFMKNHLLFKVVI